MMEALASFLLFLPSVPAGGFCVAPLPRPVNVLSKMSARSASRHTAIRLFDPAFSSG